MKSMIARWTMALAVMLWPLGSGAVSSAPAGTASFSPLARQVWKAGGREWIRSESGGFHIFGKSPWEVADARAEAELAWEALDSWLGRDLVPRPARLFIVSDHDIWRRVLQGAGRRTDSLAIQAEDELFILREPTAPAYPARLPHELVHLKLWRRYGDRVPLWLDEGLASYLGWRAAGLVAKVSGSGLNRRKASVPADRIRSPGEIQAVRSYGEMGPAFYRQAEEMVAVVARRTGDEGLADFARAIAEEGLSWEDYLTQRLKWSALEVEEVRKEMMNNLQPRAR